MGDASRRLREHLSEHESRIANEQHAATAWRQVGREGAGVRAELDDGEVRRAVVVLR